MVGELELIGASDASRPTPLTRMFPEVPAEAWSPWAAGYPAAHPGGTDDPAAWTNNFGLFIVRTGGRTTLVDLGAGPGPVERLGGVTGRLDAVLADLDVAAADVDTVVITHLHVDHVGWALENGAPRFPNARHVLHQADWDWFCVPASEGYAEDMRATIEPLRDANVLTMIDASTHVLDDGLALELTPGHTPGHLSLVLESAGELALLGGDLTHHPAQVTHPDWCARIDVDKPTAQAHRERLLDRVERAGGLWACGHLPPPSIGFVRRFDGERRWMPVE